MISPLLSPPSCNRRNSTAFCALLSPISDHRNPEMAIVIQKNSNRVLVNNEVNINETWRADTRMTSAEYHSDNPQRLANEIDAAIPLVLGLFVGVSSLPLVLWLLMG